MTTDTLGGWVNENFGQFSKDTRFDIPEDVPLLKSLTALIPIFGSLLFSHEDEIRIKARECGVRLDRPLPEDPTTWQVGRFSGVDWEKAKRSFQVLNQYYLAKIVNFSLFGVALVVTLVAVKTLGMPYLIFVGISAIRIVWWAYQITKVNDAIATCTRQAGIEHVNESGSSSAFLNNNNNNAE